MMAKPAAMEDGRCVGPALRTPDRAGQKRHGEERGAGHIGGGEAGMGEDGREESEEKKRNYGGGAAGIAASPPINSQAGDPIERQDAQAGRRHGFIVAAVLEEDSETFIGHGIVIDPGGVLRTDAHEVGSQGAGDAGERRVLRFPGVITLIEPFHAAGNVGGFIEGVAENRIGGYDADGSQEQQGDYEEEAMAFEKGKKIQRPRGGRGDHYRWRLRFWARRIFALRGTGRHGGKMLLSHGRNGVTGSGPHPNARPPRSAAPRFDRSR